MTTLRERLQAVIDADDAITAAHELRRGGTIVHRSHWRGVYALREKADRELWGTHADDRAAMARVIAAALNASDAAADARGYARAMGDANALLKAEAQSAVDKARASNDPTKEGYSMAVRDMRAAVRGLATKQAAAAERD